MFCPQCGGEYREGFTMCADCEVPLVADPPAREEERSEDDPHRLVPVLESVNPDVIRAALNRLDAAGLPHSDPALPWTKLGDTDPLPAAVEIQVVQGLRELAERCLTGVEEYLEAAEREAERRGFTGGPAEEVPPEEIRYCPHCGHMHRGFSRCVDCGVPLSSEPPVRGEAEPVALLSTLDVEELASARRILHQADIPFEWGRLTWDASGSRGEPRASPLVAAGRVQVRAAREREARAALRHSPGLVPAAANEEASAPGEEPGDEPEDLGEESEGGGEGILYCPRCHSEYRAGFSRCADCGATLVDRLPSRASARRALVAEPAPAFRCESCGAPLPRADAFCPHCSPPDEDDDEDA